ncbi:unnamed protein product [Mytilus coruscus]|uniref:Uncharacterized protein n=1 Tax=Mytilus coruscus TaxID=42192 RepID=A0A6J8E503_MYTCO|nr:unnamed protein product [Mytilus coruscus]
MEKKDLMTDMQKMDGMSTEKCESLNFYTYLCQNIGSEKVVRIRRLVYCIPDMSQKYNRMVIASGSKGEGLDLKGGDEDILNIDPFFKVYESETEVNVLDLWKVPLLMKTEETQPCFTQLRLLNHPIEYKCFKNMWQKSQRGCMLSSEQYKLFRMSVIPINFAKMTYIHGPCLTDMFDRYDIAGCLKCDKWILQVQPWQGINCFASSETLRDYQRQSFNITEALTSGTVRIAQKTYSCLPFIMNLDFANMKNILYYFLHHSRTGLSKGLLALYSSKACLFTPDTSKYLFSSVNKRQYLKYKYDISHLLIGVHSDSVSGWLTFASFFYVHKHYFASLSVINHVLQKISDEKFLAGPTKSEFTFIQKHGLNLMKKEKLYTVLKALRMEVLFFNIGSSIIPQELQLEVTHLPSMYHPIPFAYFLSFLCYYHLQDNTSCRHYLQQLTTTIFKFYTQCTYCTTLNMCGIAHQLMGDTHIAKLYFQKTC